MDVLRRDTPSDNVHFDHDADAATRHLAVQTLEVALELAGDGLAGGLGEVGGVAGLLERADVVGDVLVLLGELVDAALPGAGVLGQVAERDAARRAGPRSGRAARASPSGTAAGRRSGVPRPSTTPPARRGATQASWKTPTMPVGPSYVDCSSLSRSTRSGSVAVPVTGIGRVCGVSASSAPRVITSSPPRSSQAASSSAQNCRQRMFGSMPRIRITSRSRSGGRGDGDLGARPGEPAVPELVDADQRAGSPGSRRSPRGRSRR